MSDEETAEKALWSFLVVLIVGVSALAVLGVVEVFRYAVVHW